MYREIDHSFKRVYKDFELSISSGKGLLSLEIKRTISLPSSAQRLLLNWSFQSLFSSTDFYGSICWNERMSLKEFCSQMKCEKNSLDQKSKVHHKYFFEHLSCQSSASKTAAFQRSSMKERSRQWRIISRELRSSLVSVRVVTSEGLISFGEKHRQRFNQASSYNDGDNRQGTNILLSR